ncbi:MAG TPA: M20/M25/M40 family metallo-hydrolase [Desulfobulbus sp.]|nr:M20/M25/M40 family metallo-hydrolase [Desulfobulbus sp.]
MPIDRERLAETFTMLCETDSPSRKEGRMADVLRRIFTGFGPEQAMEDDSARLTGSECGNLLFRFAGSAGEPLFFNCHMDTVEPGVGVRVRRRGDIFTSAGDTVLGSDDKSGIAALIEAMRVLRESGLEHAPVEFIFTTCEEIGLLGAKALDPALVRARQGYALDSSGFGRVIIGAPASNRIMFTVRGVAAHAGLHPEWGINAISLAAQAISRCPSGRIDPESTVNLGTIHGGTASNIVPEKVVIEGEVRSHSQRRLEELTCRLGDVFRKTVADWQDPDGQARGRPGLEVDVRPDFPLMRLSRQEPVVRRVARAAAAIGMDLRFEVAGGGSDANIFNGHGLRTAIIATGMRHVHSTDEEVSLADMVELTRLLISLMAAPASR